MHFLIIAFDVSVFACTVMPVNANGPGISLGFSEFLIIMINSELLAPRCWPCAEDELRSDHK